MIGATHIFNTETGPPEHLKPWTSSTSSVTWSIRICHRLATRSVIYMAEETLSVTFCAVAF